MESKDPEEQVRALQAEVRRLHALLESAPDFITCITTEGKFLYLNKLAPGYRMQDVIGTSVDSYVPPEFRERAHAAMRAASETRTVQQYATAGRVSAARIGHYFTRVSPVVEGGEVTSLVMIATDVSAIEEQRILLQVALDAGGLGIWTCNPKDMSGSWDETTRHIFGVPNDTPETQINDIMQRCIHPDDRAQLGDAIVQAIETGRFGPLQHRIVRPQGDVRWVAASGLAVRAHDGHVVNIVGSIHDVTEQRALEARLLEAQKLESIGRLAGGIAHDFNNMLTAILGNVHFAQEAESLSELQPFLAAIQVAGERSAALTAQLLAFARRQVIEPKVLDPNALIQRLDKVFQRAIGEHIRAVSSLAAKGRVRADESQLEQVVMNLVTNARDAMPAGGALTLETLDVELDQDYADRQPDVMPGRYVMIAISDTGAGIPPETLPHVFEPFFTTRSSGTGLGLATCYGIVKQSGGHISVYSELGQGTTFKVYFPRVDEDVSQKAPSRAVPGAAAGERVLLVEDESPVRTVVERTLGRHGYQVVSAVTAEEALGIAAQTSFDILVTDVVLPGISGRELAQRLSAQSGRLRVLFISGYTENAIVHGGVLDQGIQFLQKPFLPSELLTAVRKALDSPIPSVDAP